MNKLDPDDRVDLLQGDIDDALKRWLRLRVMEGVTAADISALAENTLFSFAAAWERFRSEWYIAALNKDASVYRQKLIDNIDRAVRKDLGDDIADLIQPKVDLPLHFNAQQVRSLIDGNGQNVSFTTPERRRAAIDNLAELWHTKSTWIHKKDYLLINLVARCRNAIAHRPVGAMTAFNEAINTMAGAAKQDRELGRNINAVHTDSIDAYPKAITITFDGEKYTRAYWLGERLEQIGEKLRVEVGFLCATRGYCSH